MYTFVDKAPARALPFFLTALVAFACVGPREARARGRILAENAWVSIELADGESETAELGRTAGLLARFLVDTVAPRIPPEWAPRRLPVRVRMSRQLESDGVFRCSEEDPQAHPLELRSDLALDGARRLLAHELFHLLHCARNPREQAWAREGLAQAFEWIALGAWNGRSAIESMEKPDTPLAAEYEAGKTPPAQYGHDLLALLYLLRRCGGPTLPGGALGDEGLRLFWRMAEPGKAPEPAGSAPRAPAAPTAAAPGPLALVDRWLAGTGCPSAREVLVDFELARFTNRGSGPFAESPYLIDHSFGPAPVRAEAVEALPEGFLEKLEDFRPILVDTRALRPLLDGPLPARRGSRVRAFCLPRSYPQLPRELRPGEPPLCAGKTVLLAVPAPAGVDR